MTLRYLISLSDIMEIPGFPAAIQLFVQHILLLLHCLTFLDGDSLMRNVVKRPRPGRGWHFPRSCS